MTADDSRWQTIIAELCRLQVEVTDYTTVLFFVTFRFLDPLELRKWIIVSTLDTIFSIIMCKRVLSEAASTPSKRANQARFGISPIKLTYQNNLTTYVREIRSLLIILQLRRPSKVFMIFALSLTAMIQWRVMKTTMSVVWKAILYSY